LKPRFDVRDALLLLATAVIAPGCDALLAIRDPDGHLTDAAAGEPRDATLAPSADAGSDDGAPDGASGDATTADAEDSAPGADASADADADAGSTADADASDGAPAAGGFWSTNPPGATEDLFADVTGDGLADLVGLTASGVVVWPSNGKSFVEQGALWLDAGLPGGSVYLADVTGDGRADAIETLPNSIVVFPSSGAGFGPGLAWAPGSAEGNASTNGSSNTQFADVDGDGRADLVAIDGNGVWIGLSNGSAFADAGNWTAVVWNGDLGTAFAPIRGSGRSDAIGVQVNGVHSLPSTGQYFDWGGDGGAAGSQDNYSHLWTPTRFAGAYGTYFVDVSGDGKADAIAVDPGSISVLLSNGTVFAWPAGSTYPPQWASLNVSLMATFAFADVNGDKCSDFIAVYPGGVDVLLSDCATAFRIAPQ
jgi:hypothetical protein